MTGHQNVIARSETTKRLSQKYEKGQNRATKIIISLVPRLRLRLGTHIFRALPGNYLAFWPIMEAEPPGHAFPGGAWEREVWHDFFSILSFETASEAISTTKNTSPNL